MRELLIGCGSRRDKIISPNGALEWSELITLDCVTTHNPDVVWDLNTRPLPFEDNHFDGIHAYEVLEHLGNGPGDHVSWFAEWSEWYRLLKPGGYFCGTTPAPTSRWVWGDPSHRRAIPPEMMIFLVQPEYTEQIGKTAMSDFREIYQADFQPVYMEARGEAFCFALQAIKPSRIAF